MDLARQAAQEMYEIVLVLIELAFIFCVCFAVVSDARSLRIANWISLALVGLFAVYALMRFDLWAIPNHMMVAAVVLVVGFVLFVLRWIGAGDVKFMSALGLWMGPEHIPQFALLTGLGGAVLAIGLLILRQSEQLKIVLPAAAPFKRAIELAEKGVCPYGIAIGFAALMTIPAFFIAI
ncbi:MAG: prepilin peptidase [Pseudomonadota bacterium]